MSIQTIELNDTIDLKLQTLSKQNKGLAFKEVDPKKRKDPEGFIYSTGREI